MDWRNDNARSPWDSRPYIKRKDFPEISIYLINVDAPTLTKLSCIYCKRTIIEVKARADKIIGTPMPVVGFYAAERIVCSLCGQHYRLLTAHPF